VSYGQATDKRIAMRAKVPAKLSSRFQICIPKAVRTARRWQAGQEFAFIPKGGGVLLVPVPRREDLAGLARGASPRDYRDRTDRA
jgi:AbrB family looped-hinge helix DNA binding protein